MTITIVVFIIVLALAFEFINGFHDTANAVATSVATRSLTPFQAIILAAICNIIGALISTNVALTIGSGLVDANTVTGIVVIAALFAAITWNLITWWFGIPSSSSHALIGGLIGAIWVHNGAYAINFTNLGYKVILPMIASPILAFILAFVVMIIMTRIFSDNRNPRKTNNYIREMQVLSTAFLSFSHGSNDAQKTMAIISLTLLSYGMIDTMYIPTWVILACAICMGLGTLSGGMRIIKTLSTRVAKLKPANGFAAEISSASLIFMASLLGFPVSTTQAASGSIMGAGITGKKSLRWDIIQKMVVAWCLTLPICMGISIFFLKVIMLIKHI